MQRSFPTVAIAAAFALLGSGCVRSIGTMSVEPSAVYVADLCPGLQYDVVGQIDQHWNGWGVFAAPSNGTPNFAAAVTKAVNEKGGDAAMDVKVSDNLFLLYAVYYFQLNPRHRLTGKIIKYRTHQCVRGGQP
jgi:hypothetical protein